MISREMIVQDRDALCVKTVSLTSENIHEELSLILEAKAWVADKANSAFGLAAPQVGGKLAWFVMRNPNFSKATTWFESNNLGGVLLVVGNPKIVSADGKPLRRVESCFSSPGKDYDVFRYPEVVVDYDFIKGDGTLAPQKNLRYTGVSAQVFQHEFDHLRGLCVFNTGTER